MKQLPPSFSQNCLELALELTKGPELFDARGKPTSTAERYNGKRVANDDERSLMVGALRLLQCSDRQIASVVKCDVRSIPLMLRAAEKSGRIPALKERLSAMTGENAERAQIALRALLERASTGEGDVDLASMIKAVATAGGINTTNFQLLTGGPTEILELKVGAGREEIDAWARSLAIPIEATTTAVDLESSEKPPISQQIEAVQPSGHKDDTATPARQSKRGDAEPAPGDAAPGRGGSGLAGGATMTDGSTAF